MLEEVRKEPVAAAHISILAFPHLHPAVRYQLATATGCQAAAVAAAGRRKAGKDADASVSVSIASKCVCGIYNKPRPHLTWDEIPGHSGSGRMY